MTVGNAFASAGRKRRRCRGRPRRMRCGLRLTPVCLVALLAACSTGPAASTPSTFPPTSPPSATPPVIQASPDPTKTVGDLPGDGDLFTGILANDSIEGGCAYLQAADGRRFEVIFPDGWRLQRSPLELIGPDGSVHSRAGDEVSVRGAQADDVVSICQIGPIIRAVAVLDP